MADIQLDLINMQEAAIGWDERSLSCWEEVWWLSTQAAREPETFFHAAELVLYLAGCRHDS